MAGCVQYMPFLRAFILDLHYGAKGLSMKPKEPQPKIVYLHRLFAIVFGICLIIVFILDTLYWMVD